jgi:hypothetical protein
LPSTELARQHAPFGVAECPQQHGKKNEAVGELRPPRALRESEGNDSGKPRQRGEPEGERRALAGANHRHDRRRGRQEAGDDRAMRRRHGGQRPGAEEREADDDTQRCQGEASPGVPGRYSLARDRQQDGSHARGDEGATKPDHRPVDLRDGETRRRQREGKSQDAHRTPQPGVPAACLRYCMGTIFCHFL